MAEAKRSSLKERILSALVLGPVTLAIIYYGGIPFILFVLIAIGLSFREWVRMAGVGSRPRSFIILGFIYLIAAGAAFIDLRLRHNGIFLVTALLLCVWASDIGAYAAGKMIGGKKLCPKISPNKTWAGLGGAMFCAGISLGLFLYFTRSEKGEVVYFVIAGLIFGAMGQAGDLMISLMKRRVGFKDTGTLIPGHGGLLDRIDSLLLVAPSFLLAYVLWL